MNSDHAKALLLWLLFPLVVAWLLVVALPLRLSRWAIVGETGQQRTRRRQLRERRVSDWAQIEQAMAEELARRGWPNTGVYRSILLSGRWSRGR